MLTGLIMYVKLFQSIYQGTLRGNSNGLLVFTNLLAHADQYGIVDVHPKAIAEEVGLTLEQVKEALTELEAPDIESRSPESEGRRIVLLDGHRAWGWQIVNYVKYRAIKNEDDRREQNREAQARWREKNKQASADVSSVSRGKPMQKQKHIQKKEENTGTDVPKPIGFTLPDWINADHWNTWHSCPKRKKANNAQKQMTVDKLMAWRDQGLDYAGALENAALGGYQGLFLPDKGKQDVARQTVPAKQGPDPMQAVFAERDRKAAPIPQAIREQMAKLTNMVKQ